MKKKNNPILPVELLLFQHQESFFIAGRPRGDLLSAEQFPAQAFKSNLDNFLPCAQTKAQNLALSRPSF
jgi:hypothetical protein